MVFTKDVAPKASGFLLERPETSLSTASQLAMLQNAVDPEARRPSISVGIVKKRSIDHHDHLMIEN